MSLSTFLLSVVTLIALGDYLYRNPTKQVSNIDWEYFPYVAAFMLSFSVMQLLEYFLWLNQGTDPQSVRHNTFWSLIAYLVITIQPLVAIVGLVDDRRVRNILLTIYAVFFVLMMGIGLPTRTFRSVRGQDGHLEWKWLHLEGFTGHAMLFVYFVMLLVPLVYCKNKWFLLLAVVTLVSSVYFYANGRSWGTMWCWSANVLSLYFLYHLMRVQ